VSSKNSPKLPKAAPVRRGERPGQGRDLREPPDLGKPIQWPRLGLVPARQRRPAPWGSSGTCGPGSTDGQTPPMANIQHPERKKTEQRKALNCHLLYYFVNVNFTKRFTINDHIGLVFF